jgi:endonuclease III-like uncharacterized protein
MLSPTIVILVKKILLLLKIGVELRVIQLLSSLIQNPIKLTQIYQEFHALIVEHGKRYYSKKPYGNGCFLLSEKSICL